MTFRGAGGGDGVLFFSGACFLGFGAAFSNDSVPFRFAGVVGVVGYSTYAFQEDVSLYILGSVWKDSITFFVVVLDKPEVVLLGVVVVETEGGLGAGIAVAVEVVVGFDPGFTVDTELFHINPFLSEGLKRVKSDLLTRESCGPRDLLYSIL